MRSFIILLLFVYSFNGSNAQTLIAEFPPIRPKENIDNLLLAHKKDSAYLIAYLTDDRIAIQSINKDGKPGTVNEKPHGQKQLVAQGYLSDENAVHFIYFNARETSFVIVSANTEEPSSLTLRTFAPFEAKEMHIANIVSNNIFYSLSWNKNKGTLNIRRYNSLQNGFDIKSIPINNDLADKLKSSFTVITSTTIPEPIIAVAPKKCTSCQMGKLR